MEKSGIVLIGMAGVGKSTVGRLLAQALDCSFIDVDDYVIKKSGRTVQEIVDEEGEEAFLELEKKRLFEIDLSAQIVLAPGGSIIYRPDLMDYLRRHTILVYLEDSFENIAARLNDAYRRGIIGLRRKSLKEVYEERKPLYAKWADITLSCQGKSPEGLVREILDYLAHKNRKSCV